LFAVRLQYPYGYVFAGYDKGAEQYYTDFYSLPTLQTGAARRCSAFFIRDRPDPALNIFLHDQNALDGTQHFLFEAPDSRPLLTALRCKVAEAPSSGGLFPLGVIDDAGFWLLAKPSWSDRRETVRPLERPVWTAHQRACRNIRENFPYQ
jgi:hypothetical protein